MLNPSDSVVDWVLKTVPTMGAGWCPPGMLGIGIGGTAEKAMLMAKESLMDDIDMYELLARGPANKLEELRIELYEKVNALGIGAQGLGGLTTVLDVKIRTYPTHAASKPVAMIPNCAATRHAHFVLDGSGPGGAVFSVVVSQTMAEVADLAAGDWTVTATVTATKTATPTPTATMTATGTATKTATPTATATATVTAPRWRSWSLWAANTKPGRARRRASSAAIASAIAAGLYRTTRSASALPCATFLPTSRKLIAAILPQRVCATSVMPSVAISPSKRIHTSRSMS
mgnify:CR=1 FL=1